MKPANIIVCEDIDRELKNLAGKFGVMPDIYSMDQSEDLSPQSSLDKGEEKDQEDQEGQEDQEEEEEEGESLFKADAVNEEDSERDRGTQV